MKVSVEKPGSPEEVLEHFGKKGMKWGVRNKATTNFKKANPTRADRNRAIARSRHKVNTGQKLSSNEKAVARRLKTGEKVALSVLALSGIGTIPIAAFVGINMATRKSHERKN